MNRQKLPIAADQTVFTERGPLDLPRDLRQWVPEDKLLAWITEEVESLEKTPPESIPEFASLAAVPRARSMLCVLVLAYATSTLQSEDICHACHTKPAFRKLCGDQAPFRQEVDRFRREHRAMLEEALFLVVIRTVKERFPRLDKLAPGIQHSIRHRVVDRLDSARHLDTWDE
jgi:hypothetical protein